MIEGFKAIVIRTINYSDTSVIVRLYTLEMGIISVIARGVRKRKKNNIMGLFQPLTMVVLEASKKNNNVELYNLKEIKTSKIYTTIHTNPYKASISIFLSEILYNTVKEEEQNINLYNFITSTLLYFDEVDNFSNFHISFLLELSKHLGFYPNIPVENSYYFNLENGSFYSENIVDNYIEIGSSVINLSTFMKTNFINHSDIVLNRNQRNEVVDLIMIYFSFHIDGFKMPKSLEVLKILFA